MKRRKGIIRVLRRNGINRYPVMQNPPYVDTLQIVTLTKQIQSLSTGLTAPAKELDGLLTRQDYEKTRANLRHLRQLTSQIEKLSDTLSAHLLVTDDKVTDLEYDR